MSKAPRLVALLGRAWVRGAAAWALALLGQHGVVGACRRFLDLPATSGTALGLGWAVGLAIGALARGPWQAAAFVVIAPAVRPAGIAFFGAVTAGVVLGAVGRRLARSSRPESGRHPRLAAAFLLVAASLLALALFGTGGRPAHWSAALAAIAASFLGSGAPVPRLPSRRRTASGALWATAVALALVVTAIEVRLSSDIGPLSVPPLYDGASYVLEGVRLSRLPPLELAYELAGTHSPLWTAGIVASRGIFGEGHWQAATVRFWPTLVLVFVVARAVRRHASGWPVAAGAAITTACLPTVAVALHALAGATDWYFADLRPDLLAAALATGAIEGAAATRFDRRAALATGVWTGLAVVAKPTAVVLLIGAVGAAVVGRAVLERRAARSFFRRLSWAWFAVLLIVAPWALAGGLPWVAGYIHVTMTRYAHLYGHETTSGVSFYSRLFVSHMGLVPGGVVAAAGALALTAARPREVIPALVAAVGLAVVPLASSVRNFFVGVPLYALLWTIAWSGLARAAAPRRWLAMLFLVAAVGYAAAVLVLGLGGAADWPEDRREAAAQNRRAFEALAVDLRRATGPDGGFVTAQLYGAPAALQARMVDERGRHPRAIRWDGGAPVSEIERFIEREVSRADAIVVFREPPAEVAPHFFFLPAFEPFYARLGEWVRRPGNGFVLAKTYGFWAGGRSFTVELYVRSE